MSHRTRISVKSSREWSAALYVGVLVLCAMGLSCGSSSKSSITPPPVPNVAGSWEFIAVSSNGTITGIEVALKEGQILVNGQYQPNGQVSASGSQMVFVDLQSASQVFNATGFGGPCPSTASPVNSLGPSTITATNAPFNFAFSENGNAFNVTGTLSGDGQSLLNGTYVPQAGTTCSADPGGTITGNVVAKLSGTYTGQVCPLGASCQAAQEFTDVVTATASESSSGSLTLNLAFTAGPDSGTGLTMTGPVTGNAFSVSGTFQGQQLTWYGYYEPVKNVASIYLVNATNPASSFYAGTLPLQQIQ